MPKSKKEDKMYSILTSIDTALAKQASLRRVFIQGLVRGLGTAIGATVLLALVSSFGYQFLKSFDFSYFSESFFYNSVEE